MHQANNTANRDWMVADVASVSGVRHVVVLSADGLLMARSEGTGRDSADRLSAACSGLQSLAKGLGREFGSDSKAVIQQMVEFDGGFLFMVAAGQGSYLAVVTSSAVDPQLIAQQMRVQVNRIGSHLTSPPRQGVMP
ncbi:MULTISPECIES: roadblock/LC7 domain-containing protein [Streptomyces]|uniref:Roadblock/LC7 domain-containing protein n=1 Tax=Streptomyces lycii TaxID=2654337 RepID=A0ABQ7FL35_9ACTN|nr:MULTISPECIES: roadblock/LC7 domain-containing protein [Streptomyces]KAF4409681.1 roadblock/LC7 domain-containing protein [Streptomyces lycii]PGH46738.1 RarB [Streptomyces sp. Ru87]